MTHPVTRFYGPVAHPVTRAPHGAVQAYLDQV